MLTAITSRRSALLALAGLCVAGAAGAQSYPTKPVRIIVSYAAGGGVDMMARVLAEQLGKQMGQTFVVENKPGASGTIGADAVAKSAPDGYTLLAGGNPELTFMQAVNDKLPYQPLRDLAPLMLVANVPSVLVVNAASPIRTMAQFMERARDAKGLPYGTPGRGTPMHLAFELMNQLHGTKLIHVPYKGGGPATADVVGGQIEVAVINAPPVLPQIHAGKLRALAVLQNERSPLLPDVPTAQEAGLPGFEYGIWYALVASSRTPKPIMERVAAEMRAVAALPEIRDKLVEQGILQKQVALGECDRFVEAQIKVLGALVVASGAKPN